MPAGFNILCNCPCGRDMVNLWLFPFWSSKVLDATVEMYGLPYPGPCGDCGVCGCRAQMVFCALCTLCQIQRELKARGDYGKVRETELSSGAPLAVDSLAMERCDL